MFPRLLRDQNCKRFQFRKCVFFLTGIEQGINVNHNVFGTKYPSEWELHCEKQTKKEVL